MSQKLHDPLAKEYLEALLETRGQVKTSYELPKQAFQIDVMCTPQTPPVDSTLLGLRCGCSPAELAEQLNKNLNGVETDLGSTIYS